MQENSEIENFFNEIKLDFQSFIEQLPMGAIVLSEKWKVISINSYAMKILFNKDKTENSYDINVFSDNYLSDILPLNKIFKLKNGIGFEEKLIGVNDKNTNEQIIITGIPILNGDKFNGGLLFLKNEEEHKEQKDLYINPYSISSVLEHISSCYFITDLSGNLQLSSSTFENKCVSVDLSKINISEVFNNIDESLLINKLNSAFETNKFQSIQLDYISESENIQFNAVIIPLLTNGNDKSLLFLLKEKNIPKNDAIDFLSGTNEKINLIDFAVASSDALFKSNLKGAITFWSDGAQSFFKKSKDEVSNSFIFELFPEIDATLFDKIRNSIITNNEWEGELKYLNANLELAISIKIKLHRENKISELLYYCEHITSNQLKFKEAREEERNFFRDTVLKSDEMILQTNPYGTILFANDTFCKEFGYELDEITGMFFLDFVDHGYRLINDLTDFASSVSKKSLELIPLITKKGKIVDVSTSINISIVGPDLKSFTIYLRKYNYKEKLQLEISDSLLEAYPKPVIILKNSFILNYNKKLTELFGTVNGIANQRISEFIREDFLDEFNNFLGQSTLLKESNLIKIAVQDTDEIDVTFTKLYVNEDESNFVLELNPIISESQQFDISSITNIIEELNHVLWQGNVSDSSIIFETLTHNIEEITQFSSNEFIQNPNLWVEIIHPDDFEKFNSSLNDFIINEKKSIELEYRIITKSSSIVWINNKIAKINGSHDDSKMVGIINEVSKKINYQDDLSKKINELEKLNITKDKFISIISHDLKSPFTSIVGFAELGINDNTLTAEELKEYMGHIKDASMHTLDLVNGLLDWTRLQTGRLTINPAVVNANYLVRKTSEILNGYAVQKGISLVVDVDESIFIQADEGILTQAFNNLVSNSLKFTPKGGTISIIAEQLSNQQKVKFTVKDTGIGIEEEDLNKLFIVDEKFTTLGTEGERGTGLGLSLVKEIIEKHNGQIEVKSIVGEGTEFIFSLPVSTPSILLIDDKETERIIYSKLVGSITSGIKIFTAENFDAASKLVSEKMPMLIISENKINQTNAIDFYSSLQKTKSRYKPSYFILTRKITEDEIEKCNRAGIDSIQSKPIEIKTLKKILDEFILGIHK